MNTIQPTPEEQEKLARLAEKNRKREERGLPPIVEDVPEGLFEKSRVPRFVRRLLGIKPKLKRYESNRQE